MATESDPKAVLNDRLSEGFENLPGFSAYFLFACGHFTLQKEAAEFLNGFHGIGVKQALSKLSAL
jgi:hypothetical protein